MGYYILGWRSNSKDINGVYDDLFVDFKWMNINYIPLTIEPNPLQGEPTKEYTLTAKTKGKAPKSSKYIWNFGDGSVLATKLNDSTVTHIYTKEGTFPVKVELFDNSTNVKIADATSVAQISINTQSSKSFSYSWVRTNSSWPRYKVNYSVSGTVEGLKGNKILNFATNKYLEGNVDAEFSDYGAFKVTFAGSFSAGPNRIDTTYADGTSQVFTFEGNPVMSWYTQSFTPYTFTPSSSGVFENSNSFGKILINASMDSKLEKFDKNKKLIESYSGKSSWYLILLDFDKQ